MKVNRDFEINGAKFHLNDGNGETEFLRVGIPIKPGSEVFRGCPHCMTDAYLMDMEGSDNES